MRPDQWQRLQAVAEKVAEIAITDCDPENWAHSDKTSKELSRDQRGDAYWSRRQAIATCGVLARIHHLVANHNIIGETSTAGSPDDAPEQTLERMIYEAELQGEDLLDRVQRSVSRADFLTRANAK